MPFTPVRGTYPIQYTWTDGATAAINERIAACNGIATGGAGAPTQLTAKDWAIAIDPRESAAGAPLRHPPGVGNNARYNTLGAWVDRARESELVFRELAESVRLAESECHALPTATPTARLAHMPAGTASAIALNSDMTGDLCWLIAAMRLHPNLAVAIRIGSTEKHLRVCASMIEQLVEERLGRRTILITGDAPAGAVPPWAARTKTTHWHPVHIARASLPIGTHVESCLSTSRRVFEAAATQALNEQRSIADVACELFEDALTERLTSAEKSAIDGSIRALTVFPGCLSLNRGYILLANRDEKYNFQHNTSAARLAAVNGARGERRVVTFGRPPAGGGANHIDLYANHARTDRQRAYFWAALKTRMREAGRDVVIVGGRSGTFDIAYHSGEEPTGGGLCWDIAGAAARDPEVDRLQQQAGPGGISGLSLACLPPNATGKAGEAHAGDIAARLTELLAGAGPGLIRNATFLADIATQVPGAESQAMRNAEVGRYRFQRATTGRMTSTALGATMTLHEQVVSDNACKEANKARPRPLGVPLPFPVSNPKPVPNRDSFRCPACGNTQQTKGKYLAHRTWERH
ncbi:hypothetical protein [Cystobacter fuscus]|nr:hypothetical protein [Cystobacter fuscus]